MPQYFAASPFRADDIMALQRLVGLPLVADPARLALEFGLCFRRALDRIAIQKSSQPPSERRHSFRSLRGSSRKLIAELGAAVRPR
jgi:hypothetical protein